MCNSLINSTFRVAKWTYFAAFVLTAILAWLLRDYGRYVAGHVGPLSLCKSSELGSAASCIGKSAVLRIGWSNCMFFGVHFLLLIGVHSRDDPRRHVHTFCLPLQLLIWGTILALSFALPNHAVYVWGQIARILASVYLVIQIFTILEFVYSLNEWLLEKSWAAVLIISTALMFGGGLATIGMVYHLFAPFGWCHLNIFFITWTLVLGFAYSFISVSPCRTQNAGLLTSAAVFLYSAFILWGALNSEPPTNQCVRATASRSPALPIIGFFVAIGSILISTLNTSSEHGTFKLGEDEESEEELSPRPDFFHLIFFLASAYISMAFTGWDLEGITPGEFILDRGWVSVWVKMVGQWLVALLYTWSLVAPAILRNRQF
eukprot:jgi/Botrbrau1/7184/Bobra.0300s0014.1